MIRLTVAESEAATTNSTSFVEVPGMNLFFTATLEAWFQILAQLNGVECIPAAGYAEFQLMVDGSRRDFARHRGPGRTGVTLTRLVRLPAGSHTIAVEWCTSAGAVAYCSGSDMDYRQIQIIEL